MSSLMIAIKINLIFTSFFLLIIFISKWFKLSVRNANFLFLSFKFVESGDNYINCELNKISYISEFISESMKSSKELLYEF
jgi:hypothetical protein